MLAYHISFWSLPGTSILPLDSRQLHLDTIYTVDAIDEEDEDEDKGNLWTLISHDALQSEL